LGSGFFIDIADLHREKYSIMGKEYIFKAFKREEIDRTPWVPFVGCHGGKLIGINAEDYLKSSTHMVNGLSAAIERYKPDGIPVVFDLQIEAEALGCELKWSESAPPAVISHPMVNGISLQQLSIPKKEDGRIPEIIKTTQILKEKYPDVALYGLITGPFTMGLHLLGTEIFVRMMEDPGMVHELMKFTSKVSDALTGYYIEAGCDVIAIVDPMTSQIDPVSFETFVTPYVSKTFQFIKSKKAYSSFFVCGHAQQNIEEMCKCKPDNISIDENIPLDYVREMSLKYNLSFGGNLKLTLVLLLGSKEDAQKEAVECIDIGGKEGFILSPGCDLPMDTPPENLEAIVEVVYDNYTRDVVRTMDIEGTSLDLLNMKDYGQTDKVIVDIITLDSESCAPCQYMVEAVKKIAPHFEGIVEWREHPIKKMESISFMSSLMVKNIPTICIDGKISFVSKIPPKNDLIAAIQKRINEKLKLKIKSKKGEILILGKSTKECMHAEKNVMLAINETGVDLEITTSTDEKILASYGILNTPAIIVAEYKLKTQGEVPDVEIIKEWIKDI
jgi:uroporphyrinogen decarboxylase